MTLPKAVLFPQALMPLHIFEERYRQMLADALDADRLFAVAMLDEDAFQTGDVDEPPHDIASIGYIRASQQSEDGTSNLILQGISRVRIVSIAQEFPYRVVEVLPLMSRSFDSAMLRQSRVGIDQQLEKLARLADVLPEDMLQFLKQVEGPDAFIDIAAASYCGDVALKQTMLETLNTEKRYSLYANYLKQEIDKQELDVQLRGGLSDAMLN